MNSEEMAAPQQQLAIVFGLVIGLTIAPLGIVAAFGQEQQQVQQEVTETSRLSHLSTAFEGFGFDTTVRDIDANNNGTQVQFYGENANIAEDLAGVIAEHYGFELTAFEARNNLTVAYNNNQTLVEGEGRL